MISPQGQLRIYVASSPPRRASGRRVHRRAVMLEVITVGLDVANNLFQVRGADEAGYAVLRKK